jgi:hypothetical protein
MKFIMQCILLGFIKAELFNFEFSFEYALIDDGILLNIDPPTIQNAVKAINKANMAQNKIKLSKNAEDLITKKKPTKMGDTADEEGDIMKFEALENKIIQSSDVSIYKRAEELGTNIVEEIEGPGTNQEDDQVKQRSYTNQKTEQKYGLDANLQNEAVEGRYAKPDDEHQNELDILPEHAVSRPDNIVTDTLNINEGKAFNLSSDDISKIAKYIHYDYQKEKSRALKDFDALHYHKDEIGYKTILSESTKSNNIIMAGEYITTSKVIEMVTTVFKNDFKLTKSPIKGNFKFIEGVKVEDFYILLELYDIEKRVNLILPIVENVKKEEDLSNEKKDDLVIQKEADVVRKTRNTKRQRHKANTGNSGDETQQTEKAPAKKQAKAKTHISKITNKIIEDIKEGEQVIGSDEKDITKPTKRKKPEKKKARKEKKPIKTIFKIHPNQIKGVIAEDENTIHMSLEPGMNQFNIEKVKVQVNIKIIKLEAVDKKAADKEANWNIIRDYKSSYLSKLQNIENQKIKEERNKEREERKRERERKAQENNIRVPVSNLTANQKPVKESIGWKIFKWLYVKDMPSASIKEPQQKQKKKQTKE